MFINMLLKKTSAAFNSLSKQYGANALVYTEQTHPDKQCTNTTGEASCPIDTAIVIDVSVSMEDGDYYPTRLDGGIEAGIEYVNVRAKKHSNDRIAVVSFSDSGCIVLGLTNISKRNRIVSAIESLMIEGGTNITTGLQKAISIFSRDKEPGCLRRVILLTDGHGGYPVSTAEKLKNKYSAVIDVIGIGGSHKAVNEKLLRKVATTDPDGFNRYYFIKDSKTLKEHYRQLATGLVWSQKRND